MYKESSQANGRDSAIECRSLPNQRQQDSCADGNGDYACCCESALDECTPRKTGGLSDTGRKSTGEPDNASMHPIPGDGRQPSYTAVLDGGDRVSDIAA